MSAFLTRDYVNAKITQVQTEAGIPVRDVAATVEFVGKQLRFTAEQQNTILNHFLDGGDRSCGGVLHARPARWSWCCGMSGAGVVGGCSPRC